MTSSAQSRVTQLLVFPQLPHISFTITIYRTAGARLDSIGDALTVLVALAKAAAILQGVFLLLLFFPPWQANIKGIWWIRHPNNAGPDPSHRQH